MRTANSLAAYKKGGKYYIEKDGVMVPRKCGHDKYVEEDYYYQLLEENRKFREIISQQKHDLELKDIQLNRLGYIGPRTDMEKEIAKKNDPYEKNDKLQKQNKKMRIVITKLQNAMKQMVNKKFNELPVEVKEAQCYEFIEIIKRLIFHLYNCLDEKNEYKDNYEDLKELEAGKNFNFSYLQSENYRDNNELNKTKKILEETKKNLKEYIDKYTEIKQKNRDLEDQLLLNDTREKKLKQYEEDIKILKENDQKNRDKILELSLQNFEKSRNTYKEIDPQKELIKCKKELNDSQIQLKSMEKANNDLKKKIEESNKQILSMSKEVQSFKDESMLANTTQTEFNQKLNEIAEQFGKKQEIMLKDINEIKRNILQVNRKSMDDQGEEVDELTVLKRENEYFKNELQKCYEIMKVQQECYNETQKKEKENLEILKQEKYKLKKQISELITLINTKDPTRSTNFNYNTLNSSNNSSFGNMDGMGRSSFDNVSYIPQTNSERGSENINYNFMNQI